MSWRIVEVHVAGDDGVLEREDKVCTRVAQVAAAGPFLFAVTDLLGTAERLAAAIELHSAADARPHRLCAASYSTPPNSSAPG